jgi:hypothetical protein
VSVSPGTPECGTRCARFVLLLWLTFAISTSAAQVPDSSAAPIPSEIKLELRLVNGSAPVHAGELVPIELIFSSQDSKRFRFNPRECHPHQSYRFLIAPPAFVDRLFEVDAALGLAELTCGGGNIEINLAAKPVKVPQLLNGRYRMTPGKYRIAVQSGRMGVTLTSNFIDLEILPRDAAWEAAELARAVKLLEHEPGKLEYETGCRMVRYLGTDEAHLAMAQRYGDGNYCDHLWEAGIISAGNRPAVQAELESGLASPARRISLGFIRTLAFVSLYREHPEWFPAPTPGVPANEDPHAAGSSGLWKEGRSVKARELHYVRLLLAALPQKTEEARAQSVKSLIDLEYYLRIPPPDDVRLAIRAEMPVLFRHLSASEQERALRESWPKLAGPAMIPPLVRLAAGAGPYYSSLYSIALARLYELSPAQARPYILKGLRDPDATLSPQVLGMLPEKELPALDHVMLKRLKARLDDGPEHQLGPAAALIQRYASTAIAPQVVALALPPHGGAACDAEINLIAYSLRVNPARGVVRLRQALSRPDCSILPRLAKVRMSAEVEAAALAALSHSDPEIVRSALETLRYHGSAKTKPAILQHFRQWRERAPELDRSKYPERVLEDSYLKAIVSAQSWINSITELTAVREICITASCKAEVDQVVNHERSPVRMIGVFGPRGPNEFQEHYGVGLYHRIDTLELVKRKIQQYPRGSAFSLDSRSADADLVERTHKLLQPFASQNGYQLTVYREP